MGWSKKKVERTGAIRRWQQLWDRETIGCRLSSIQERVNLICDMGSKREENIILKRLRMQTAIKPER